MSVTAETSLVESTAPTPPTTTNGGINVEDRGTFDTILDTVEGAIGGYQEDVGGNTSPANTDAASEWRGGRRRPGGRGPRGRRQRQRQPRRGGGGPSWGTIAIGGTLLVGGGALAIQQFSD